MLAKRYSKFQASQDSSTVSNKTNTGGLYQAAIDISTSLGPWFLTLTHSFKRPDNVHVWKQELNSSDLTSLATMTPCNLEKKMLQHTLYLPCLCSSLFQAREPWKYPSYQTLTDVEIQWHLHTSTCKIWVTTTTPFYFHYRMHLSGEITRYTVNAQCSGFQCARIFVEVNIQNTEHNDLTNIYWEDKVK